MPKHLARLVPVAVAAALLATAAQAQDRPHLHRGKAVASRPVLLAEIKAPTMTARPLTVRKQSFLDPGNVVEPGTDTPEYIAANTTEHVPIYNSYAPARFGESTLAGPFDLPDNPRYFPNRDLDFSPF